MKFFNDMSIAKKLLGAFSAIVLVIVVAGGITVYEIDAADGAVAENQTLVQFGKDLGTLERAGAAQLLAVRGLLLTGDRGQIDAYREAVAQFDATVERMAGHAPTAEAQSAFEGLVALVRDWQTETAATQIEGMSNPLTVDAARAMEANGLGSDFMLALNEAASALKRATEVRIQAAEEATETSFLVTIIAAFGGSLVALIIATVAYFALKGAISAPIARMTEVMGVLADGRDDVDVPNTRRADEVGAMGRALEVFKQNAIERREALAREEEAREKEKEQVKAREERTRRIEELIATFDKQSAELVEALSTSARSLEDTSKVMNESAENTDKQATAVAAASEEASTNVQTVASAAEQLRASITEIAEQVAKASDIAGEASSTAEQAQGRISRLETSANSIGEVVSLINEIAEQTNLLALNATIEAARAGEAGKGFAVVAEEVKSLASQTAQATDKIRHQIEEMQAETVQSVQAIQDITAIITQVNEYTSSISSAVEEQASATDEIAMNVNQASGATDEVASNIQLVHQSSSESGKTAGSLLQASSEIAERARAMKSGVEGFVKDIRAL